MEILGDVWLRITTRQAPLDLPWLLGTVAVAALVVTLPVWRLARHGITIVHEAGHGVAATLSGRRLSGIRLHPDTSGVTVSRGPTRGPGMILTLLAGYTAPPLLGLGAAWLLSGGFAVGLLWSLLLVLALVLLQIRNWFGLWSVLVSTALVFAATWLLPPQWQTVAATGLTAFLLLGSVRTVLELQLARSRHRARGSDADQLARLTGVPGVLWVAVFLVVCLLSLGGSASLLGLLGIMGAGNAI